MWPVLCKTQGVKVEIGVKGITGEQLLGRGLVRVLGRIVNLDRIPNTEYVRVLKMNRIRIPNSAIQSKLFE